MSSDLKTSGSFSPLDEDGQLPVSTFQKYSPSKCSLAVVIWPNDSKYCIYFPISRERCKIVNICMLSSWSHDLLKKMTEWLINIDFRNKTRIYFSGELFSTLWTVYLVQNKTAFLRVVSHSINKILLWVLLQLLKIHMLKS